ncbi:MAG: hypothetical protein HYW38_01230 [Candidatus Colwellbacteria bacterium]|nr:hypothetical protein [Candidatus Colwellbacteria bacterium]
MDFILTVIANVILVHMGVVKAIVVMIVLTSTFNIIFLHLLGMEKEFSSWVKKQTKKWTIVKLEKLSAKVGKSLAILIAYIISGPAMVGAPLIWLLGVRGKRAYLLAIAGVTLNTIFWVGGFYNLFWTLVKVAIARF